jgi:hypothetical protein
VAKRTRKGNDPKLLIVDDDGTHYDKLEPLLQAALPNEVYFLDSGVRGYKKFWTEQTAIWAAVDRPRRRPGCGA